VLGRDKRGRTGPKSGACRPTDYKPKRPPTVPEIFTIGHSNLGFDAFTARLTAHGVEVLADVRAAPFSRRYPQFNREALDAGLKAVGIRYRWLGEVLGGLRSPQAHTPHSALTEPAFQAYAEHMATPAFRELLGRLIGGAQRLRIALMCAEADPAHCHRQFIADALSVQGMAVRHIRDTDTAPAHCCHPGLRQAGDVLIYDRHCQSGLFTPEDAG